MATVTAEGCHKSGGVAVSGASVKLWDPATVGPKQYNDALPGGSPAYGPDTTDADGNWSIASVTAGLYWVSIDDGSTITWQLSSFEPVATTLTTSGGSGSGSTWSGGPLPLDFGSTNHMDVIYTFNDLGGNIYGVGTDDSTLVLFTPNGGGKWSFRRATSTPSGWNGTALAEIDASGNVLANGGTSSNPGHAFLAEPALGFYRQASGVIGATGHLRPAVTATSDLGSTSLRWSALWAGAATLASAAISGALSAGASTLGATSAASLTLGTPLADAYVADALTISGGTVDNTPIGNTTRALGKFTTLDASTTVVAGTTVTAGTGITATTGNIAASSGNVTASAAMIAGTTVTAGTGLVATLGNITASAGNIVATLGNITASAGNISATAGSVSAGTSVTAGTFATISTYLDVGTVLGVGVSHDATKARAYILDASVAQLRLAQAAAKYADFTVDSSGVLVLDTSGNIFKQAAGESFRSFSYTSGVNGFSINSDGDVEANNIRARGELRGSTFVVNEIQAFGGTTFVSKSAGTFNAAFTSASVAGSTASSDTASVQIKNTLTNAAPVVVGDVMWVKTVDPTSGIFSCYFEVRAASTGASVTTCTLRLRSGSTSVSIPAGASFVVLGTTSGGAWISQSADGAIGAVPNLTMATHSGSPWSTTVGRVRLGNLNGTFDYATDVYGLVVGADIGVSAASFKGFAVDATSGLRLYNAALAQYNAGTQTVNLTAAGTFALGTNVGAASTTTLIVAPAGGTHGSETLAAGAVVLGPNTGANLAWTGSQLQMRSALTVLGSWDATALTVGEVGASKNNVYIASGALSVRNNTTERIGMTAAGVLTIKDSGGAAVFTFDASSGAEFTKPLTLATTGGIYQGSGTFASPTTGLKLWNDSGTGRLGGYNGGTLQWYGATDGKLYAGAGAVVLDANGLTLIPTVASTAIRWAATPTSANYYGIVDAATDGTINSFQLASGFPSGSNKNSVLSLTALSSSTTGAGTRDVRVQIRSTGSAGSWVEIGSVASGFRGIIIGDVTGTAPASGYFIDVSGAILTTGVNTANGDGYYGKDTGGAKTLLLRMAADNYAYVGNFKASVGTYLVAGGSTWVGLYDTGITQWFNTATTPGTPTGGPYTYAASGALKGKGTSGTVTTIAAAEPHCPRCGSDFVWEWSNPKYGGRLALCAKCLVGALKDAGITPDRYAIATPTA